MTEDKKNTDAIAIQAYNLCDGAFTIPEQKIYNGGDFVFTLQGNSYKIKIGFIHKDANDIALELKNNKIAFKILGQIQNNISIKGFHFISYNCVRMHIVCDKIMSDDNELNTHSITFEEHGFILNRKDSDVNNIINFNNSKIEVAWIEFFSNGALKMIRSVKSQKINASYNGQMYYDLPIKENETIYFTASGEIKDTCIEDSPERSAIVYAERLKAVEAKTEKLEEKQKVIIWNDIAITLLWFSLSLTYLCWGLSKLSKIEFGGGEFIAYDDYNKYTFLYELLKRIPAIILFVVAFKFLQFAFERIRLVGEVERVQKYIKLTNDGTTKNKLLKIIALPFFTKKKMRSSVVAKLQDRKSSVALEGKEETH